MPDRPGNVDRLEKLDRWLPSLAPRLPLAIPEWLVRGAPSVEYPAAWSIVRWLDGEEAMLEHLAPERVPSAMLLVRSTWVPSDVYWRPWEQRDRIHG